MVRKDFAFNFENKFFAVWFSLLVLVQNFVSVLLGGERCLCCSKKTLRIPLCKDCLQSVASLGFKNSCCVCGRELISEIGICTSCRENRTIKSIDGAFSLNNYQLWKKSLLFSWKLEDKRNLSPYFAAIFYQKLTNLEKDFGRKLAVVPVPPREGKIREKGWDQIDELCYYLKNGWNIRILPLLERLSKTQQKKLDRVQRLEGMESAYRLKPIRKIKRIMSSVPDAVVLVDDVLTTGSTIEACARELKKLGIKKVFSITLFIVD